MNIHEYQAKALLKGYGAPVADGVADLQGRRGGSRREVAARPALCGEEPDPCRRPRQGQVQGTVGPDAKGGVRLAKSVAEVVANAKEMLGNTLVTKQTGPAGKQVNRLYIEDGADIARELYLSLLVDRSVGRVAFVVSTEGGMDIEAVAHDTPEKIITVAIDPGQGRDRRRRRQRSPRR